ncbi:MAG: fibronectin type III domain-containing protein [Gammaproteobacteria bacterium]|nr:fibronectin type III domain-containing protein [Gammaproteobacteria bacterium]
MVNPGMKTQSTIFCIFVSTLLLVNSAVAQSSDEDYSLASRFAPIIHLSAPNSDGNSVDLQDSDYPYSDFYPMRVDNLLSVPPSATIDLRLDTSVTVGQDTFPPDDYSLNVLGYVNLLGSPGVRSATNSLLFDPLWLPFQSDEQLTFKKRAGEPTVYFRVFRDTDSQNPLPIAIQYWFFYFYNDWILKHPGDWESVTVFLGSNADPLEIIFSTKNEANKYSWSNEIFEDSRSEDHVSVFVSNGGHGSYAFAGETDYSGVKDRHWGDGGSFDFQNGDYTLIDLGELETNQNSWIWFEGRWGNDGVDISNADASAPKGPRFRKDAVTGGEWFNANNRPYDPYNDCLKRDYGANIYDPWYWASGYGLDTSWSSTADCLDATLNVLAPVGIERAIFDNQVSVSWNSVANASGYRILVGSSSREYHSEFDTSGLTTVGGNVDDGTYYLAIQAYNQFSESEPSEEIVITVGQNGTPLAAPTDLDVQVDNETVTISWGAVFGASGYKAQYGPAPGQYVESIDLGTSIEFISDLAPGTYYFRIAGYDTNMEPGLYSSEIEVFVSEPLVAPTLLSPGSTTPPVPAISGLSTTLQWNAIQGATFYKLVLRDLTNSSSVVDLDGLESTSFEVTNLQPGHDFRWNVQACNSSTCSDASVRFYFQTN